MIKHLITVQILSIFSICYAIDISDSLYVEGCYSQSGTKIRRGALEKFLFDRNESQVLVDQSKGFRVSAWAIGATMWTINTGYSVYQIKQLYNAFENNQMITPEFDKLAIPLSIAGSATAFVQTRLTNRADFLLFKAVMAFNQALYDRDSLEDTLMDHRIKKAKSGYYFQDRVWMPSHVLYAVLRENSASRPPANWSTIFQGGASIFGATGSLFLLMALAETLEPVAVNVERRNIKLGVGIGLLGISITNSLISSGLKKSAIRKYNESLP